MSCQGNTNSNMEELSAAIAEARKNARRNNFAGHASIFISVIGAIGVTLLASKIDEGRPCLHIFLIILAALPAGVTMAEKALRPAQWEAWYARKALALSAIYRHVRSSAPSEGGAGPDGALPVAIVDWWNKVDDEFEKSRPSWGARDGSESERAKAPRNKPVAPT